MYANDFQSLLLFLPSKKGERKRNKNNWSIQKLCLFILSWQKVFFVNKSWHDNHIFKLFFWPHSFIISSINCKHKHKGVIPCKIIHSKNESLPIVFILSTQSAHPMRVHNPEYQPPVTSGSSVTGWTKKFCPIKVGLFLLIVKICTSFYSGTRRLIFRIMYSYRTYTSILDGDLDFFLAKNCVVSGGMAQGWITI